VIYVTLKSNSQILTVLPVLIISCNKRMYYDKKKLEGQNETHSSQTHMNIVSRISWFDVIIY